MPKVEKKCAFCSNPILVWPSRAIKAMAFYCNKSCHRSHKNVLDNPSRYHDFTGQNNPMWGKHPKAWNKGVTGKECHNWRGGVHKRKDGYVRINIDGKRHLLHRYLLGKLSEDGQVVHHIDGNPSNNDPSNLKIMGSQAEHAKLHAMKRHQE